MLDFKDVEKPSPAVFGEREHQSAGLSKSVRLFCATWRQGSSMRQQSGMKYRLEGGIFIASSRREEVLPIGDIEFLPCFDGYEGVDGIADCV